MKEKKTTIFEAGDVVTYYPYGEEEFTLKDSGYHDYPLQIVGSGLSIQQTFTKDGKHNIAHTQASLKLVRRPQKQKQFKIELKYVVNAVSESEQLSSILIGSADSYGEARKLIENDNNPFFLKTYVIKKLYVKKEVGELS